MSNSNDDTLISLDRQRKTTRRVIFISFVVAAVLAWGMMGFVYLLVIFLK